MSKDYKKEMIAQRDIHTEVFGPWLEERGWHQFYNDHNWVNNKHTHSEIGVPADIAVMMELGLKEGRRFMGHTIALI